ncbi:MAG: hypothetical protein APF84_14325 [Gracilibacter sp. BRH_c7a]|nr:MAG: hypothetical protein APF84_14325 [Gracilibacter sp. BRH_c7a]
MSSFWRSLGERITEISEWSIENHPGKSLGLLSGFLLALLLIIFGFLQTVLLIALSCTGYYLGKCWDDGRLPPWLNKIVHRISFRGKDRY